MKRIILAGVIALAAMGIGAASVPGTADAGFLSHERAQDRAIQNLQGQVTSLKQRVGDLEHLAYQCDFYDSSSPVTFDDGTVGYPLYADPAC